MSIAQFDTLSDRTGSVSVPVNTVVNGSAKAWVNFNGTGTVAIRASFNVASITDNGTGDYTINFTTALPDTNYSLAGECSIGVAGNTAVYALKLETLANKLTSSVRVLTNFASGGSANLVDVPEVSVAVFR